MDRPRQGERRESAMTGSNDRDGHTQGSGDTRRSFLKAGVKGALLLPYVAPLIETISLSGAHAQTSPIDNTPPPPPPPPVVISCDPDNGLKGETLDVAITGADFVDAPTVTIPNGVVVNSVTFISSSELIVSITIRPNAAAGPTDVTVENPDRQSDTLYGGFTIVSPPPPTVKSCKPKKGDKGQTLDVLVDGADFVATPKVSFTDRIRVNSVTFVSSSELIVNISIRPNAAAGPRNVTVENPDRQTDTLVNGFTVN